MTRLVGDPQTGVIHGGAVSALMDTCGGAAVMSHPEALAGHRDDRPADRLHAARHAGRPDHGARHCYHVTRSVAFVRAEASTRTRRARGLGHRRLHREREGKP
jgi:acyl-coenzyme A thioesterase PaaI-like protein